MIAINKIIGQFLGVLLLNVSAIALPTPALAELSLEEINSIARQTTVVIAPGLTPELVAELEANRNNPLAQQNNPDGVWNPGSGVIIARNNNTYYVLTVTHNFKQRYLEQNQPYGIRTSDGLVYEVKEINDGRDCPLEDRPKVEFDLLRFGCYSLKIPRRVAGADLAIVSFQSDRNYPVASVGDVDNVEVGERIYISGWPDPEKEKDATTGNCRGKVARRQRRLAWTPITRKIEPSQGENGYSLFYFDQTRPGMSGGPVFDNNGFVIGVHGRGSADRGKLVQQDCSVSVNNQQNLQSADFTKAVSEAVNYDPPTLHTLFSSGQNFNNFVSLLQNVNFDLAFQKQSPSQEVIEAALTKISDTDRETGEVSFDPQADITGRFDLSDRGDVVEDIYKGFSLKNMIRDEPSPGCRFLLLGEDCN
ncbi:MAG: serine protease [Xenococcaceae cyanobacterium MO_188.B32]|nr:serine protease [Xenococcaceae cyanobacterium MO_188.B32]